MKSSADGQAPPGINWGPFTLRIPFYHFGFEFPEFLQGLAVAGATGLALIPILEGQFGVSFEVALCVVIVQSILISTAPLIYGDPYCHGWITPAIPLVLYQIGELRALAVKEGVEDVPLYLIQSVTAFTILVAVIFLIGGVTGLGRKFVEAIPVPLKAGIILGAAIAAFQHEFNLDPEHSYLARAPISCVTAVSLCMILVFSLPLTAVKHRMRWLAVLAGLGLAPGFITAMVVGKLTGELSWNMEWGLKDPPWTEMWNTLSPLSSQVGFPNIDMFVSMLPLAIIVYVIGFGDIITANEVLRDARPYRPDEQLDINPTRTHYNIGIRNMIQALVAGPFPVAHGPLWTGVHVVVVQRYKQGRQGMKSLFGGIGAYYFWGLPVLLYLAPVTSFLQPMLPVALSMTILLTGFACAYLAISLPRNNAERGVALTTGMLLVQFGALQSLIIGLIMTIIICGLPGDADATAEEPPPDSGEPPSQ